ncbi:DNA ligase [Tepiditoga spiralis]|uniref:DNA ligase n=1 Tax=Tepiditoga spiralis TaxID=2108365 RepID=A0A7G1GBN6_9BACT|nr:NAD-dependent DNA ligase LigA [Tepiditoga spiralis]BBE31852.1 DNA ligase [Tepiditoga spiralis]
MSVPAKLREKYEKLKKEIEEHNYRYYIKSDPIISDTQYDKIFKELITLEENFPELKTQDSPTQRVGGIIVNEFKKVEHTLPMLSLDNTYNEKDIIDFNQKIIKNFPNVKYYCELKIDGVSISLKYKKGKLIQALTRGDGIFGEDVTQNIKTIRSIPLNLNEKIDIEVRGEVFMPINEFKRINEEREIEGLNIFANPRNSAAGTLKLLDSSKVSKRRLDAFIYYILFPNNYNLKTQEEAMIFLKKLGFKINEHNKICKNENELIDYWIYWSNNRKNLDYDIDGAVAKVNEFSMQRELGETSRAPRWAIAFKFKAERKLTQIKNIKLQVGSSGIITPVAEFEAIQLEGSTVKKASLHNFEYIKERDIREKDFVYVEKAGGIIPQVVGVKIEKRTGEEKIILEPQKCPECGGKTGKINPSEVAIRCLNPLCPAKLIRILENFVSRDGMNIEGLGPKLIERMVKSKLISDPSDLYYLNSFKLATLGSGIGIKTINNLLSEIEKSKDSDLENLLFALGIPLVGIKNAKNLAIKFKSIDKIQTSTLHELMEVEGIGEDMARSIKEFFNQEDVKKILLKLKNANVNTVYKKEVKEGKLSGYIVSQTGELKNMNRREFSKYVESKGGIFSNNVTKKTKILVVGENPGSKLEKAKKFGISIMLEEEFFKNYN